MTITSYVVGPNGAEHEIIATAGQSVLDAVGQHGIDGLLGECGGCCSCATCHCYVEADTQAAFALPDEAEITMLDFVVAPRQPNSRLACQLVLEPSSTGLRIRLPERQF
jgi:2Fe-2S ferredoxin